MLPRLTSPPDAADDRHGGSTNGAANGGASAAIESSGRKAMAGGVRMVAQLHLPPTADGAACIGVGASRGMALPNAAPTGAAQAGSHPTGFGARHGGELVQTWHKSGERGSAELALRRRGNPDAVDGREARDARARLHARLHPRDRPTMSTGNRGRAQLPQE